MQSISAMNSQSSINRVQIDWNFSRENVFKVRPGNCCQDWLNVVAKVGRKIVAKFSPKSCKIRPRKWCKIRLGFAKIGQKVWSKIVEKLSQESSAKKSSDKNCCKNQMRSISAINSQSSLDWVTILLEMLLNMIGKRLNL